LSLHYKLIPRFSKIKIHYSDPPTDRSVKTDKPEEVFEPYCKVAGAEGGGGDPSHFWERKKYIFKC
jgi:hypothetical protein